MNSTSQLEFESTQWSVVLRGHHDSSPDSRLALETLCRTYWYPLYAYVRRRGHNGQDAQDLTQEFFCRLLEQKLIAGADPQRGKFRSYLLAALQNFLVNQWHKSTAIKRGGGQTVLSLDFAVGESRFLREPSWNITAESLFDRQWAETLVDSAMARLENEYVKSGREQQFHTLKPLIAGRNRQRPHAQAARVLGISESATTVAVSRLRGRFRDLLQFEIAQTVTSRDDMQDEVQSLFKALGE